MNPFQKILSFFDPLFGTTIHVRALKIHPELIEVGLLRFRRSVVIEWRYSFSDIVASTDTIFCVDGADVYYRSSGERWTPPSSFYVALKEFEYFMDRADEPLRKEKFAQILGEEN